MGGEAAGVCGVWWELCEEVTEGWGIAIEIVMVGWIFEKEAGCKCRECCVGEESCPSGDEGGGSRLAQRCWRPPKPPLPHRLPTNDHGKDGG